MKASSLGKKKSNHNGLYRAFLLMFLLPFVFSGCNRFVGASGQQAENCALVEDGYGPRGEVEIKTEIIVRGLEVPWGIAFLPDGDVLVTERPGRIRLVRDFYKQAQLVEEPVASMDIASTSEGGLLGIALHPEFEKNRLFYIYVTVTAEEGPENRIERWQLSPDNESASRESIIFDGIPAARVHNGGRLAIGPDNMLYIGTGDATNPDASQDLQNTAGKLLRIGLEGEVPSDNPYGRNPVFLYGIRNTQGWVWPSEEDAELLWLIDHGPSGDLLRFGHDEVNVADAGDNLGWPPIYGCQTEEGMKSPVLSWEDAVPPGGADIYTGEAIPEWQGDLLIATLGSKHLHRVIINDGTLEGHEVYLQDEYGRLREISMGDDGNLYITTSNCDGRGDCPSHMDVVIRVSR